MPDHIVILLHGIRTRGEWHHRVADGLRRYVEEHGELERVEFKPLGYGLFDIIRFLTPIPFIRRQPIIDTYHNLKAIRAENPEAMISIVAHSYGTITIAKILQEEFEVRLHHVVLVGSIVPLTYKWFVLSTDRVRKVLNEVGTRDIWPLFAKAGTWGYGISGWLGFKQGARVVDRYWHSSHSSLLTSEHAHKHIAPFLFKGDIDSQGQGDEARPYWTHLLGSGNLKYVVLCLVALATICMVQVSSSRMVTMHVPARSGMHETSLIDDFLSKEALEKGLLVLGPRSSARLVQAQTVRWTNDRLQNIESLLSRGPFLVDISLFRAAWAKLNEDEDKFLAWLEEEHDKTLVAHGLASSRPQPITFILRAAAISMVKTELVPILRNKTGLPSEKHIRIECSAPGGWFADPATEIRKAFYKRVIALGLLEPPFNEVFGPYFGVDGKAGSPSIMVNFPAQNHPVGCLVAVQKTKTEFTSNSTVKPFYLATHRLTNDAQEPVFFKFMMNDDIPEDNGDGFCTAEVELIERTSFGMLILRKLGF